MPVIRFTHSRIPKVVLVNELFVDVGFNTGLTHWKKNNSYLINCEFSLIKAPSHLDTHKKLIFLWDLFFNFLKKNKPDFVTFEDCELRSSSLKSLTSARRGDLFKLDRVLAGYLCLCNVLSIPCGLVKAIQWKGNMSDEMVQSRISWLTNATISNPHTADSFGIALDKLNIFK